MITRRAVLDEETKEKIRQRVKTILDQGESDQEPASAPQTEAESDDSGEGTLFLFDAADHGRRVVAIEFNTKEEFEKYKEDHDLDPHTRVKIKQPSGKPQKKEEAPANRKPKKEEPAKAPSAPKKEEKPAEKTPAKPEQDGTRKPGDPLPSNHPSRIPEGMHRQVAIKDSLIDEFGAEAKNWRTHKIHPSQITMNVTVRFPDGTSKKYGQLSPDEKARVDKAVSSGLAASKGIGDYTSVSTDAFHHNMGVSLARYDDASVEEEKNENEEPVSKDSMAEVSSSLRENGRTILKKYAKSMSSISRPMAERFVDDMSDAVSEAIRDGSLSGVKQSDLDEFVREEVKRLIHQEAETRRRSLGDHGIRHVAGNARNTMSMLGELQRGGANITGKQKLMALSAMANHDIGYTVGDVAVDITKGKAHKAYSKDLVEQEKDRYDKIFGEQDGKKLRDIVATHDDPDFDWEADPVGASVRLADNTSLFGDDKVQDLFLRSPRATELACKLQLAAAAKPQDKGLQDKIKGQLHEVVDSGEFEDADKEALHAQIDEMSEGKFSSSGDVLSRFSGKLSGFSYDPERKVMNVNMKYSSEGQMVDQLFGDELASRQFGKLAKDLGAQPVRGKRGNTVFKGKDGKPVFQLNIDGFDGKDEPATAAMRRFKESTARSELTSASRLVSTPPDPSERDVAKAKAAVEGAKDKFSKEEWDKLMEAFDSGEASELSKKLGSWPLLQSETAFLESMTASDRIARRLTLSALAERVASDIVAARGMQTTRKDKDLMSDTGGTSKHRKTPELRPPRPDARNRYRTKIKTPEERDPDTDRREASTGFESIAASHLSRFPRTFREIVWRS